jgi:zinc protease
MPSLARIAPALLAVLVGAACSLTRPAPPSSPPVQARPQRHVLTNGLRVVVQEFPTGGVVALQLWVAAGGRDESTTELGLAHCLEHMLFKGTTTRAAGAIQREIEGVGGRITAITSVDYTAYDTVLPVARARAGIELLADIAVNASLETGALESEKGVVLEEIRLSEDSPRRHLTRRLYGLLFEGHPYGRPVIGTPEVVRGLTRETLVGFYRRHYVPETLVLVVVGPVNPAEVLATAERTFGRIPRTGLHRLPLAPPPPPRGERREATRPGAHAYLGLAWHAPRLDHADTAAMDLLVSILGQLRSSRLTQTLRDRLGLVTWVSSGYSALAAAGAVTVMVQAEPGRLADVEAEILRQLRRLREDGVTDAERRRALTAAEARHAFGTETAEGLARAYGRAETVWRLEDELAYRDRLRSVTVEQLQTVARHYLDPERYARLAFVPPAAQRP